MPNAARCGSTTRAADELVLRDRRATSRRCASRPARASSARARATRRSSTCPTATPIRASTRRRQALRLPHALHADAAAGRPQGRAGRGDAGAEQARRRLRRGPTRRSATVLAAQCAVALQRVRMTEALIEGERMRRELEMARAVQMSTLPAAMPALAGLRRLRHVPARRPHRRRHLRPRARRRRACWWCSATPPATASRPRSR